jgi:uncharacterized membrane protein
MIAPARLSWLDAARGLAVVAMVGYHLVWDLGNFDYIDPDFPYSARFKGAGHAIALSFLFIAGVSLVLAHRRDAGWSHFWRRFGRIAAAAALVTFGTYLVFPQAFVFFGILHCIAAASLLCAPFLSLPWTAALLAALAAFLAPSLLASPAFDPACLSWIGLSTIGPSTNDYRPLLPWSGAMLAGVAFARFPGSALLLGAGRGEPKRVEQAFGWLGRHSLAIYLLHQPALFAIFLALARFSAPPEDKVTDSFTAACEARCETQGGPAEFCLPACLCVAARERESELPSDPEQRALRLGALAKDCLRP